MRYEVERGRILTWSLEAHVVDHCNLRCDECCTLSPHLPSWSVDPVALEADLRRAARALRPQVFKLTGGEPLLHARLADCIEAVRASEITPAVSMTTNGRAFDRLPDAILGRLDRVTLSVYSSAPLGEGAIEAIERRCRASGVLLTVKRVDRFSRLTPSPEHVPQATARTQDVFDACWLRARCHLVRDGRFYTCTRPPHLQERLRALGVGNDLATDDGVALDGDDLAARLLGYLERTAPLSSCAWCLGASGGWVPHRQIGTAPASLPGGAR